MIKTFIMFRLCGWEWSEFRTIKLSGANNAEGIGKAKRRYDKKKKKTPRRQYTAHNVALGHRASVSIIT